MDKRPEYNFVETTMSRPLCEKPQLGKKRKATVAQGNEQEGGSEPPYEWRRCARFAYLPPSAWETETFVAGLQGGSEPPSCSFSFPV